MLLEVGDSGVLNTKNFLPLSNSRQLMLCGEALKQSGNMQQSLAWLPSNMTLMSYGYTVSHCVYLLQLNCFHLSTNPLPVLTCSYHPFMYNIASKNHDLTPYPRCQKSNLNSKTVLETYTRKVRHGKTILFRSYIGISFSMSSFTR